LKEQLADFARRYPRNEKGGILLGTRSGGTAEVLAAVFPPQAVSWSSRCEFEATTLSDVCEALDTLGLSRPEGLRTIGWIHTHPNLQVFLSETDLETFRNWAALDPQAIALVLDPFARRDDLLVWNGAVQPVVVERRRRIGAPTLTRPDAERLARALLEQARDTAGECHVVTGTGAVSERGARPSERAPVAGFVIGRHVLESWEACQGVQPEPLGAWVVLSSSEAIRGPRCVSALVWAPWGGLDELAALRRALEIGAGQLQPVALLARAELAAGRREELCRMAEQVLPAQVGDASVWLATRQVGPERFSIRDLSDTLLRLRTVEMPEAERADLVRLCRACRERLAHATLRFPYLLIDELGAQRGGA
jgi:proteasome lid subunit RPN8/RPN11